MIDWKKVRGSFSFAFEGIKTTFKKEQNFRIHSIISLIVVLLGIALDLSEIRMALLLVVIASVLTMELLNTAIERTIDLVTQEKHPMAKQAKDAAAGAVLVFSIIAVIIGILLFAEPIRKVL